MKIILKPICVKIEYFLYKNIVKYAKICILVYCGAEYAKKYEIQPIDKTSTGRMLSFGTSEALVCLYK